MRKRTINISFRVTEAEQRQLQAKVKNSRLSQTEYIIQSCIKGKLYDYETLDEITRQIKGVSNNVNQIARKVNTLDGVTALDLKHTKGELNKLWLLLNQYIQEQT